MASLLIIPNLLPGPYPTREVKVTLNGGFGGSHDVREFWGDGRGCGRSMKSGVESTEGQVVGAMLGWMERWVG